MDTQTLEATPMTMEELELLETRRTEYRTEIESSVTNYLATGGTPEEVLAIVQGTL